MIEHIQLSNKEIREKIRQQSINFGGNQKLKIYGTLQCLSGKRMKRENRVFFESEQEARENGYRPCGHCLRSNYLAWKNEFIR